ncbi:hypothetical protein [Lentilactobacillus farraginis]|uniref:Uncharacterized protein n=1 Tax=Lentilactobacillus farraginis DSM 18382 = JCM 14108 TaxID=1423743 RepID=X0QAV0_9LACO|nr:hypothetical protein [Lentilactobacillus farraginis]KRM01048.1 hypothetical protein FD41_GL001869 [Lentilactobacillus farraginis DSM 18382 = JCM 14108]GAF35735.1 hypothetical protein JCM14108_639 [Lentilactobacillus farraginis DSM 18382 = JCM 14108]
MILTIQIIIGLAAAFAVYNLIHYLFVTRPSRKRLLASQRTVNKAVIEVIKTLISTNKLAPINEAELHSEMIANIWGRGVMAFEYHLPIDRVRVPIPELKALLGKELAVYSDKNGIHAHGRGSSAFVVTDIWQLDDRLHFDVAYLINLTTVEYIDDLNRLH